MKEHIKEGGTGPEKESFCPCPDISGPHAGPGQLVPGERCVVVTKEGGQRKGRTCGSRDTARVRGRGQRSHENQEGV